MRHSPDVLDYEGVFLQTFASPTRSRSGKAFLKRSISTNRRRNPQRLPIKKDEKPSFMEVEAGKWQAKRGHGLTFACLFSVSFFTSVLTS